MRVSVASDLHMEYAPVTLRNTEKGDVLLLCGDIMNAWDLKKYPWNQVPAQEGSQPHKRSQYYRDFFEVASKEWSQVLYVAGNHEYYGGTFNRANQYLQDNVELFPNVKFLQDSTFDYGGVRFVGATLWTDLNKGDSLTEYHVNQGMNDYYKIKFYKGMDEHYVGAYRALRPKDTFASHQKSRQYMKHVLENSKGVPLVFMSHHAPTSLSVPPEFKGDYLMNGAYFSDLSDFMLDNTNLLMWAHGHMHSDSDYKVGNCRVICNPRGYVMYEQHRTQNYSQKTFLLGD